MADKSISYRFLGKDDGLGKTLGGLGDKSDKLHLSLGKLAGAFAGGIIGAKGVDLIRDSVNNASDLNESLSKTRVVFGGASKGVEAFAKNTASSLGQSKQQALEATSTFGNLFRALGIGEKPAANLSTKLVTLAGDLASFNNVDPAEALEALRSGLLGEAEPLRKFGVTLSQTRIQAEALADGIVKPTKDSGKVRTALLGVELATKKLADVQKAHGISTVKVEIAQKKLTEAQKKYGANSLQARAASDNLTTAQLALNKAQQGQGPHSLAAKVAADNLAKANVALAKATHGNVPALTAAQKATAAYNIIMKDTKTAQGDFGRTSGGLANQQRILKAEFADASATLGTKLLPVATKVVTAMTNALKPGSHFRDVLSQVGDKAKKFEVDAKPIFTYVVDHKDMFTQIAKDAVILGAALKATSFLKGLTGLGALTGKSSLGGLGGALGKIGTPVPVVVTNPGFGTPSPPAPGTPGAPSGKGKKGPFGAAGPDAFQIPLAVTGAAVTQEFLERKQQTAWKKQVQALQDAKMGASTSAQTRGVLARADAFRDSAHVKDLGGGKFLTDPKVDASLTSRGIQAAQIGEALRTQLKALARQDESLEDPRRAAAAARQAMTTAEALAGVLQKDRDSTSKDLTALLAGNLGRPNVTYNITANGVDPLQVVRDAEKRQRLLALSGHAILR